jgi:hypothetical protein
VRTGSEHSIHDDIGSRECVARLSRIDDVEAVPVCERPVGRLRASGNDGRLTTPRAERSHHDEEIAAIVAAARETNDPAGGMKPGEDQRGGTTRTLHQHAVGYAVILARFPVRCRRLRRSGQRHIATAVYTHHAFLG